MQVYTYSEARQKLASVLDKAEATGSVVIQRRDGRSFTLVPQKTSVSPLDVPSVGARISTGELVNLVRKERGTTRYPRVASQARHSERHRSVKE